MESETKPKPNAMAGLLAAKKAQTSTEAVI